MGHRGAVQPRLGNLAIEGALAQRDMLEIGEPRRDSRVDQPDLAAAGHALRQGRTFAALGLDRRTVEQVIVADGVGIGDRLERVERGLVGDLGRAAQQQHRAADRGELLAGDHLEASCL